MVLVVEAADCTMEKTSRGGWNGGGGSLLVSGRWMDGSKQLTVMVRVVVGVVVDYCTR